MMTQPVITMLACVPSTFKCIVVTRDPVFQSILCDVRDAMESGDRAGP